MIVTLNYSFTVDTNGVLEYINEGLEECKYQAVVDGCPNAEELYSPYKSIEDVPKAEIEEALVSGGWVDLAVDELDFRMLSVSVEKL